MRRPNVRISSQCRGAKLLLFLLGSGAVRVQGPRPSRHNVRRRMGRGKGVGASMYRQRFHHHRARMRPRRGCAAARRTGSKCWARLAQVGWVQGWK
ncbi:MAG: hypothetical protein J3K34DRAFT_432319 [Monoraphidium minutum]|nr:MAG: hypothetical protein J3K34DRAFT_432319 [Monoraphidium minutum]